MESCCCDPFVFFSPPLGTVSLPWLSSALPCSPFGTAEILSPFLELALGNHLIVQVGSPKGIIFSGLSFPKNVAILLVVYVSLSSNYIMHTKGIWDWFCALAIFQVGKLNLMN